LFVANCLVADWAAAERVTTNAIADNPQNIFVRVFIIVYMSFYSVSSFLSGDMRKSLFKRVLFW